MSKRKITRAKAADELEQAEKDGYELGRKVAVGTEFTYPVWHYSDPPHGWRWQYQINAAKRKGYEAGQEARLAEMELITLTEVEKRVAAAIAELPECRPVEEEETVDNSAWAVESVDGQVVVTRRA